MRYVCDATNTKRDLQRSGAKETGRGHRSDGSQVRRPVKIIRDTGNTISKEIPIYFILESVAVCVPNRSFVRVHGAGGAAAGRIPEPAGGPDVFPLRNCALYSCRHGCQQIRAMPRKRLAVAALPARVASLK